MGTVNVPAGRHVGSRIRISSPSLRSSRTTVASNYLATLPLYCVLPRRSSMRFSPFLNEPSCLIKGCQPSSILLPLPPNLSLYLTIRVPILKNSSSLKSCFHETFLIFFFIILLINYLQQNKNYIYIYNIQSQ